MDSDASTNDISSDVSTLISISQFDAAAAIIPGLIDWASTNTDGDEIHSDKQVLSDDEAETPIVEKSIIKIEKTTIEILNSLSQWRLKLITCKSNYCYQFIVPECEDGHIECFHNLFALNGCTKLPCYHLHTKRLSGLGAKCPHGVCVATYINTLLGEFIVPCDQYCAFAHTIDEYKGHLNSRQCCSSTCDLRKCKSLHYEQCFQEEYCTIPIKHDISICSFEHTEAEIAERFNFKGQKPANFKKFVQYKFIKENFKLQFATDFMNTNKLSLGNFKGFSAKLGVKLVD